MSTPEYAITTPENVELRLELAGLGNRMLAAGIDICILSLFWFVLIIVVVAVGFAFRSSFESIPASNLIAYGAMILLTMALFVTFGYFIFFEGLWRGQTPGKKIVHIRVIDMKGQPIGWVASLIRNLIRLVDQQAAMIGLVSMLLDKNERRIGDFAAGTLVIRERVPDMSVDASLGQRQPSALVDVGRISPDEYNLLVTYFRRRQKLPVAQRQELVTRLAQHFGEKLALQGDPRSPETLLEDIYLTYRQ